MTYDNWKLETPEDEEHRNRKALMRSLYGRSYWGDPDDPRDDVREDYHEDCKADYDRDGGDND